MSHLWDLYQAYIMNPLDRPDIASDVTLRCRAGIGGGHMMESCLAHRPLRQIRGRGKFLEHKVKLLKNGQTTGIFVLPSTLKVFLWMCRYCWNAATIASLENHLTPTGMS
ncbi:hypothetical protein OCU04_009933 [Sclerotinia nivalis]|uniref:Uncharacterized protein n=1 Tax=Sclerotinia nivalis TaxID=352851 RepID=A0A9X0ADN8_9HELO|nr:hypothetical protein OCU04_009933 [Sclerotinia nivalis]